MNPVPGGGTRTPPGTGPNQITPGGPGNLPEVGRSAAQGESQQPLTSGEPPLHATQPQKPFTRVTRNNDDPQPRGSTTNNSATLKHRFPLQRETPKGRPPWPALRYVRSGVECLAAQPRGGFFGLRFSTLFHGPGDDFDAMKFPKPSYLSKNPVRSFFSW